METIRFDSLPGCTPYRNERSMRVRAAQSGLTLLEFLCVLHPPTPRHRWLQWIACGDITLDRQPLSAEHRVQAGERYLHVMPDYVEPAVNATIGIIHADDALLVIDKPAPLPIHPSGRFNRNTLSSLLASHYPDETLRIAHRLDANTTGVVVLCRTAAAAAFVQPQFEQRVVEKQYLVRVHGHVPWDEHRCELPIGDARWDKLAAEELARRQQTPRLGASGTGGARVPHRDGRAAETLFRCRERLEDNTSLLIATPITGRTNQIRVHVAALGFPIVGDPFYGNSLAENEARPRSAPTQTLALGDPPMCLHAWRLALTHPTSREVVCFESPPPPNVRSK